MCVSPVRGLVPPYPARDRRLGLCDPTRTRTEDTQVKSLLLYQLSYRTKSPRYYTMYVLGETSQRCFTATRHSSNNRPRFDYSPPRNRSGRNSSPSHLSIVERLGRGVKLGGHLARCAFPNPTWIWSDSNRQPSPCKSVALPLELQTHCGGFRADPPTAHVLVE